MSGSTTPSQNSLSVTIRTEDNKPLVLFRVDLNNRAKPLDCLRFQSGAETFKIKSLTKMRRLQDAWLKTPSCVPATVLPQLLTEEWRSLLEFTLQGQPLTDDDTAQSLGMEDKAVLIVRSLRSSPALTPIEAAPLRLADDIAGLLEKEEFHDVSFLVGGERVRIGANRTILAARSERFRYLVVQSNSPPDSQMEEARTGEVVVPDHSPASFRSMLRFVYSGEVDTTGNIPELAEVLAVAHYYCLAPFKARLEEGLLARVGKDSVAALLQSADLYDCPALKDACREYIAEHFAELKATLASSLADSPELLLEIAEHFSLERSRGPKRRRVLVVEE